MVAEQMALMTQRLDALLDESERLMAQLLVEGNVVVARDLEHFAVDVRVLRRMLDAIGRTINPPTPPRTLALVGRNGLTAPRAGPA